MVAMNTEPSDVELIRTAPDDDPGTSRTRRLAVIVLALVVLLLAAGGGYVLWRRGQKAPQPAQAQPADKVQVRQETTQIPLPPLEGTDALVRELVGGLSAHPVVAAWLATDRLIVNFVVVTGRIADGQSPVAELKAIGPVGAPFRVRTSAKGAMTIDPSSYRRYDKYAQAVAAIDAQGAARAYQTLKPRIDEADRNFGGGGNFDPELERAIVELLKVPVVEGDVALKQAGIGYAFADPKLEGLSRAQKQLLRMGPENVRAIQGKLRAIAAVLGIPDSRLPPAQ
jgi:Protein of unknown function (DUF3014)